MRTRAWDEKIFKELTGRKVGKLWKMYREWLEGGKKEVVRESKTKEVGEREEGEGMRIKLLNT